MLRGPEERLRLIAVVMVALLLAVVVQLVRLQVIVHEEKAREVDNQVRKPYNLPEAAWGTIVDRNGDLLVGNERVYAVDVNVSDLERVASTALGLAPLLGYSPQALAERLDMLGSRRVAFDVSEETAQAIRDLKDSSIQLVPRWRRYYAEGPLAAHTLGFLNEKGEGAGIQAAMVRLLRGDKLDDQTWMTLTQVPLPDAIAEQGLPIPHEGTSLRLTLDRTIQAYVEGELDRGIAEYQAAGGTIIVMNPRTGEILAMASRPTYEPWRFPEYISRGQDAIFTDPAVTHYEPGSVFKVVTVAAALDSGAVGRDWGYNDTGLVEYGGIPIRNWNSQGNGWQGLQGVLDLSLNTGVATLSTRYMGAEVFYRYVSAFGFGRTTGIEVTGESAGILRTSADINWYQADLATNSFGQGIAVTPLQMAVAVAAIANDGVMMQPHLVAERMYPDGRSVVIPPKELGRPISPETARWVTEMMARSIENKLTMAQVPGYRVAGKTGTAQIPIPGGGYDPVEVVTSFVGFGPLPDPEILVLIKFDRPGIERHLRWGTQTAAPLFQRMAGRLFTLMGIPPSHMAALP